MRGQARLIVSVAASVAMVAGLSSADPVGTRDLPTLAQQTVKRHLSSSAGSVESVTFTFGPFVVAPGSDRTVLSLDQQIPVGMLTSIEASLADATAGRVPLEQLAHIEHVDLYAETHDRNVLATSFSDDVDAVRTFVDQRFELAPAGLRWLGGGSRDRGRIDLTRLGSFEDLDADGVADRAYGIPVGGRADEPLIAVVQVANEAATPLELFVVIDATLVHGTHEAISAATSVPTFPLEGVWFGRVADAGAGGGVVSASYQLPADGMLVWAGGHAHPGAYEVVVTNQGPVGRCSVDVDGDGWPGLTLLRSSRFDHVPGTWPYSGDFQYGVSKPGWRAPVREFDKLVAYAIYDVRDQRDPADHVPYDASLSSRSDGDTADGGSHSWLDAPVRAGFFIDRSQRQTPYPSGGQCPAGFATLAAPQLHGIDTPEVQQRIGRDDFGYGPFYVAGTTGSMQSKRWSTLEPVCGVPGANGNQRDSCNSDGSAGAEPGAVSQQIAIAGFTFLPGDRYTGLDAPLVDRSQPLTFVNLDATAGIQHSISSCAWPCDGPMLGNHPLPDGMVDTGRLGVPSGIREGRVCRSEACLGTSGGRSVLAAEADLSDLPPGPVAFYCRLHPWMRGSLVLA